MARDYSEEALEKEKSYHPVQCDPFFGSLKQWHSEHKVPEPYGDPNGEPYIVQVSNANWIPISVVVFAQNEDQARKLVRAQVQKVADDPKKSTSVFGSKCFEVLEMIDRGFIFSMPFDKRYAARVDWASNGSIF